MITAAMLLGACTIDSKGFYETREKENTKTEAAVSDAEAGIPAGIGRYAISGEEIPVTDVAPVRIGQTEVREAATGCTVIISDNGMRAGLDIRGGGPASRESALLDPLTAAQQINAVVLAGGSAFGLGAANGVMEYLEKKDIGFDVGVTRVPLVVQSDIFDLTVGDAFVRPDAAMGYEAARRAFEQPNYQDGCYGAGCGATVGKIAGMDYCMKSGIGSYAIRVGDLKVGAIVVVNSLGDIFDWKTGRQVAGLLSEDRNSLRSTMEYMSVSAAEEDYSYADNTTIGVIITNADFDKAALCKIAGMGHNGYARAIHPVHTTADGDSIYAVSAGSVRAGQDFVGALAAEVMSEAVLRAVGSAESAYGYPSAAELGFLPADRD